MRWENFSSLVLLASLHLSPYFVVVQSLSHVRLFLTLWTTAHQPPLSMDFPGKSPGAGCHFLLQGIFLSQGLNLGLLHWQVDSLPLSHQGNPLHVHLGNFQLCDQLMVCRAGYSSDTFAIVCLFCGVSSKQRALFLPASTLPLEKAMAPHAGTLAWEIPWTEGPGGLQFMGSRRVGDD